MSNCDTESGCNDCASIDHSRPLLCLIPGESSLFKVEPSASMDIMKRMKLIKEEGKNGLLGSVDSDAIDLTLWKVNSLAG